MCPPTQTVPSSSDLPLDVDDRKRKVLFGLVDTWDQVVKLYHLPKRDAIRKSLFHEVIHIMVEFMRSAAFNPDDAEVDMMSELWYHFLADNKLIVDDWSHVIPSEEQK